jgi:hypothetical protein
MPHGCSIDEAPSGHFADVIRRFDSEGRANCQLSGSGTPVSSGFTPRRSCPAINRLVKNALASSQARLTAQIVARYSLFG